MYVVAHRVIPNHASNVELWTWFMNDSCCHEGFGDVQEIFSRYASFLIHLALTTC